MIAAAVAMTAAVGAAMTMMMTTPPRIPMSLTVPTDSPATARTQWVRTAVVMMIVAVTITVATTIAEIQIRLATRSASRISSRTAPMDFKKRARLWLPLTELMPRGTCYKRPPTLTMSIPLCWLLSAFAKPDFKTFRSLAEVREPEFSRSIWGKTPMSLHNRHLTQRGLLTLQGTCWTRIWTHSRQLTQI